MTDQPDRTSIQPEDWPLEDPKGKSVESVRQIRDDIRARVLRLTESMDWTTNRSKE